MKSQSTKNKLSRWRSCGLMQSKIVISEVFWKRVSKCAFMYWSFFNINFIISKKKHLLLETNNKESSRPAPYDYINDSDFTIKSDLSLIDMAKSSTKPSQNNQIKLENFEKENLNFQILKNSKHTFSFLFIADSPVSQCSSYKGDPVLNNLYSKYWN